MKNIYLIIFIFILSGCMDNVNESLFIASIGIERQDEELRGYFYLPLSNDVGKTEGEGKGSGEFLEVGGKSIQEIFNNAKAVNSLDVNLNHVSSVVLNNELYNPSFLDEFINFVKKSQLLDFNFYFFATEEKMKDIYSFQNPNQESVLNSLLVVSGDNEGLRLVGEPVHFIDFSKKFYSNRTILVPTLTIEELWHINDKKVKNFYPQSGIYYYKGDVTEVEKEKGSPYLKDNVEFYDEIEKEPIYFSKYRLAQFKNEIRIFIEYKSFGKRIEKESVINLIKIRISEYLNKFRNCDPLDFYYYNENFKEDFSYDDVKINIVILNS